MGRWVVLAFPLNTSGHFQKTVILRMCSLKSRDFGSPQCQTAAVYDCRAMWLSGLRGFLVYDMFLWEIVSRRFMSMLAYLMWCAILRSLDMPKAWSQALLWRTHPWIKLVVTVTFVMNKVEGSWARPWLKKSSLCLCQSQKCCQSQTCYVRLTDMVYFQELGILIHSDSLFRLIH